MDPQTTTRPLVAERTRPVGVWIATLWAALFAGLLPMGLVLLFYFGTMEGAGIVSGWSLLLSCTLGIAVMVSAIGTWRGSSAARYALVAFVVVHYLLVAFNNYQMAMARVEVRGSTAVPWGRAIRSVVTAAIIAGYLLFGRRAREFFAWTYDRA